MLERDDQWHFSHGFEIPQPAPCCPRSADREIRSIRSERNLLVWVCLSLGTITSRSLTLCRAISGSFFLFIYFQAKRNAAQLRVRRGLFYNIVRRFTAIWMTQKRRTSPLLWVCHIRWSCGVSYLQAAHGPLLSLQLTGENKADHLCHVCLVRMFEIKHCFLRFAHGNSQARAAAVSAERIALLFN